MQARLWSEQPETGSDRESPVTLPQHARGILVEVSDTGPGIAPADQPFLFLKYRPPTVGRSQDGTGLGLFIVKTFVEAHNGRVEVESTLGSGACFRIFLPLPL